MGNGASSKWSMCGCEIGLASFYCQFPMPNYELPIAHCPLPNSQCPLTTNKQIHATPVLFITSSGFVLYWHLWLNY
ncbi:hypothetical protein [Tolypothrix sp. VBCCA 56010]|uniref:hypothetical protein n=1 Tax=Tolypothrix sp. VBCCA 56010 TaxID=3137731 RepID=UPI003D7C46CA